MKIYKGTTTGADLGFSRGGGADFQKKFENFDDLFFFLGRPNWFFDWFFELSQSTVLPVFFGARTPSKLVYIGAFRKILGSVGQKWISEKVSKGGPFGSAGGRIPDGGGGG